ncbi:hypothetical protein ACIBH1_46965 [Nonomuraea sp. NPDC050663]|uniref:hypothetical protein n=1 Tax=Nonomuraea sp. NPDC050663 TaxID=3364370 RepID=UPI0037B05D07
MPQGAVEECRVFPAVNVIAVEPEAWAAWAAAAIALLALYFSAVAARSAKRSANRADEVAEIEHRRFMAEAQKRHEELTPQRPEMLVTHFDNDSRLFARITVARPYRVEIHMANSTDPDGGAFDYPHDAEVLAEGWIGPGSPDVELLEWDPLLFDQALLVAFSPYEPEWACPCPIPQRPSHWMWSIQAKPPPELFADVDDVGHDDFD